MYDVILPKWGLTMEEGVVTEWEKQVGDAIQEGEVLVIIETEKIENELPSPVSGVVAEILVAEGDEVPVGTVIARIQI